MKTSSQRCSGGALCCLPENSASRASRSCSRIHLSSRYCCAAVLCLSYLCVVFTLLSSYLPGVPMQPAAVLVVCHPHEVPAFPGTPVRSRSASRMRWPAHSLTPHRLRCTPGTWPVLSWLHQRKGRRWRTLPSPGCLLQSRALQARALQARALPPRARPQPVATNLLGCAGGVGRVRAWSWLRNVWASPWVRRWCSITTTWRRCSSCVPG